MTPPLTACINIISICYWVKEILPLCGIRWKSACSDFSTSQTLKMCTFCAHSVVEVLVVVVDVLVVVLVDELVVVVDVEVVVVVVEVEV